MMPDTIPAGKWQRAGIVGSTALKVGLREVQHKVKRPFLSAQRQQAAQQETDDHNARLLIEHLRFSVPLTFAYREYKIVFTQYLVNFLVLEHVILFNFSLSAGKPNRPMPSNAGFTCH